MLRRSENCLISRGAAAPAPIALENGPPALVRIPCQGEGG